MQDFIKKIYTKNEEILLKSNDRIKGPFVRSFPTINELFKKLSDWNANADYQHFLMLSASDTQAIKSVCDTVLNQSRHETNQMEAKEFYDTALKDSDRILSGILDDVNGRRKAVRHGLPVYFIVRFHGLYLGWAKGDREQICIDLTEKIRNLPALGWHFQIHNWKEIKEVSIGIHMLTPVNGIPFFRVKRFVFDKLRHNQFNVLYNLKKGRTNLVCAIRELREIRILWCETIRGLFVPPEAFSSWEKWFWHDLKLAIGDPRQRVAIHQGVPNWKDVLGFRALFWKNRKEQTSTMPGGRQG